MFIVTKSAEIRIIFNNNDQGIFLNLFERIEDQAAKDGCSNLRMTVEWKNKRLEISLYDSCCEGYGHDKFDALNYDVHIPILVEHLEKLLSNLDVKITHKFWP